MPIVFDPRYLADQFSWRQTYFAAALAVAAYNRSFDRLDVFREKYGLQSVEFHEPADSLENNLVFWHFGGVSFVGIEGTATFDQWLEYIRVLGNEPFLDQGETIGKIFNRLGSLMETRIRVHVPAGNDVVLCGHSLGGATALVAARWRKFFNRPTKAVWTFGSPRAGNQRFANELTMPVFRVFGDYDPVPHLPPQAHFFELCPLAFLNGAFDQAHVGEEIGVGELDFADIAISGFDALRDFGTVEAAGRTKAHFMGTYTEAIWLRLSPQDRALMLPLHEWLASVGGQGAANFPLEVDGSFPASIPADAVYQTEAEELQRAAVEDGPMFVKLFVNDVDTATATSVSQFEEPDFPGYEPVRLSQSIHPRPSASGYAETEPESPAFVARQVPLEPVTVRGVFCVRQSTNGPALLAGAERFRTPFVFSRRFDQYRIGVIRAVARVR